MAGSSVVGQLRVILGLDLAEFMKNASQAQKEMTRLGRDLGKIGDRVSAAGKSIALTISAPLAAAGAGVVKLAGDFEAAMNRVQISSQASAAQIKAMNDLALDLGKTTVFSASQAAEAMDELAKSGLSAQQILDGAAKATIDLAAATGSELDPAAHAITDTMANFGKTTKDLPGIVNQITGAVNQSKLDFSDFRLAMGSAAGVAGKVGVTFEDFAATLAATSSSFNSGEDAGTSFKSFLLSLSSPSKKAAEKMQELGLSFYDATGKLKPMAAIADQLREKLGKLSDQKKGEAIGAIFGSDGGRTALSLMTMGADGLNKVAAAIAKTDAAAQSAQRMKGFNAQLEQLKGSFETLAIKIGQSGVLDAVTGFVSAIGNVIDRLSEASPTLLRIGTIIAAVGVAIGPVIIAIGALISAFGTIAGALSPLLPALGAAGLAGALGAIATAAAPFIAVAAAAAAAWTLFGDKIGPVISALAGQFMQAIGPALTAAVSAAESAIEGFGEVLSALWSGPLGSVIQGVIGVIGQFGAALLSAFGGEAIRVLNAFVQIVTTTFTMVGDGLRVLARLLSGDFSGAWTAAKAMVDDFARGVISIINALSPNIGASLRRMYDEVKNWLQDRLGSVFDWVRDKVKQVGDAFYELYDRVVGHSYVPDMVDEIGATMSRLDAVLVQPVKNATDAASRSFEEMQRKSAALMNDLFPAQRELQEVLDKIQTLDRMLADGQISQRVHDIGMGKLQDQLKSAQDAAAQEAAPKLQVDPTIFNDDDIVTSGGIVGSAGEVKDKLRTAFASAREDFQRSFSYAFTDALRTGDVKGAVKNLFAEMAANGLRKALDDIAGKLFDLFAKALGQGVPGGQGGGGFLGLGNLLGSGGLGDLLGGGMAGPSINMGNTGFAQTDFSGIDSLFSDLPAFASGGSGQIKGIPGIDRNLLSLNGRPIAKVGHGETLKVSPKNDNGPAGNILHFDLRGAVMTQDLLDQMNAMAAQARDEGSAQAIGIIGRSRTRQLPRRGRQ